MPKNQPSYPLTPEPPRALLKIALSHGFQCTSRLLTTSVLGTWVIALIAYVMQEHIHTASGMVVLSALVLVALVLTMLVGVVQTDAAYQQKKCKERVAIEQVMKHAVAVIGCLVAYVVLIIIFSFLAGRVLPHIFSVGSIMLGVIRLLLGGGMLFVIVASFLVMTYRVIAEGPFSQVLAHTFTVSIRHWFRAFLCFVSWLIVIDLLNGEFALRMMPILHRIPFAPIIVITLVAVLVVPILVTYTTLLVHDFDLRQKRHQ